MQAERRFVCESRLANRAVSAPRWRVERRDAVRRREAAIRQPNGEADDSDGKRGSPMRKPVVAVIGTGGTIASLGVDGLDIMDYGANQIMLDAESIVERVPEARFGPQ